MKKNYVTLLLFTFLFVNMQAFAQGCLPSFQYGADSNMITNVQFGTINNPSPFSGNIAVYEDFSAQSASFEAGESFSISVKGPSSTFPSDVMVYIDFNQNGSFADPGESFYVGRLASANPANAQTVTTTIVIPATSLAGNTKLRIVKNTNVAALSDVNAPNSISAPCANLRAGQTEDYSIAINAVAEVCNEPGNNPGDLGCIKFVYENEEVTYTTVRGTDGNIWLQQNLGSSNVATALNDENSYGDLFQWGRWADGHQRRNSVLSTTAPNPNNPTGILQGSENYFASWWNTNGETDTWNAVAPENVTASNGCDPCKALGEGWQLPAAADWTAVVVTDTNPITNPASGFASFLKLPANGSRSSSGNFSFVGARSYYWSRDRSNSGGRFLYIGTANANPTSGGPKTQGSGIRCIKYGAPQYCQVSVENNVEPITLVGFADLLNSTSPTVNGTPAYENFTSMTANVNRGEEYEIIVEGNTVGFEHDIRVFIDWNNNGDFEMDTEYYPLTLPISTGSDGIQAHANITIPENATIGKVRMRIIKDQWTAYEEGEFDACLDAYYGQIEDYSITIAESLSIKDNVKNKFSIYPNPTTGISNIQSDLEIESIAIYNQIGQLLSNQKTKQIDLSKAPQGIYVIQVNFENGQKATKKISKK